MTHITDSQKQQIAALRKQNVSFPKIALKTGIPQGTCKTLYYKDNPATASSFKSKDGKFKSTAPRSGPGRKPINGIEAQSDKARAAACRARRKERLAELAGDLSAATDADLVALLATTFKAGNESQVKDVVAVLHGRYCGKA